MVDRKELGEAASGKDLVPGNAESLYQNAEALRDRSADVIADGEALKRIDTGGWTGPAHDAYAEDNANQWPKWLKTGDALADGSRAVEAYANCLSWAQAEADHALDLYNRGVKASEDARAAHDRAVADANARTQANAQHGGPPVQAPAFHDPGEELKNAAHGILNRARAQLDQVAAESAKKLSDLAGTVPTEDAESTGATITHAAADVVGFFPVVGDAVDVGHAGVYALQGKWTDAGLTAAAAVPFGGWGAGAARLGRAGERLTESAGKEADEAAETAGKAGKSADGGPPAGKSADGPAPRGERMERKHLSDLQESNCKRFEKKLPAKNEGVQLEQLPDGNVRMASKVPADNIPGSWAEYVKTVDKDGATLAYEKNTYGPDGKLIHSKPK